MQPGTNPVPAPSSWSLRDWLDEQIATLYPGCFALVMATGIISNALFLQNWRAGSDALFAVNLAAYPCLIALTIRRIVCFAQAIWADLINPRLVFSFFTLVAGTDVLGVGIHLRGFATVGLLLWIFAGIAWLLLIYFSFGILTFLNTAEGANVVHGGWLIAIVGTQSLVVLGARVAPAVGDHSGTLFVLIHMLWGVGLGLYGIFITLFAYRIFFFRVGTDDLTPLLWVVMGAAAISTNAGSTLVMTESGLPFLHSIRPFISGVSLIMWAWATWWIPLMLLLGVWKHGVCRVPLTYTPMFWSLVFPLGMYGLASQRLSLAADFPPLLAISHAMVWIALGAWTATFTGFAVACARSVRNFMQSRLLAGTVPEQGSA